ncbi:hypothetical protein ACFO7E_11985, partial [Cupriavidus pampae]
IGGATDALTLENVASHAALGCAAQSAMGGDCASGAIGGATSAIVAPVVRDGLYGGGESVTTTFNADGTITTTTSYNNPAYNAMTAAIAMLAGGGLAAALGQNANAAAGAAQNEALNNALSGKQLTEKGKELAAAKSPEERQEITEKFDGLDRAQTKVYTDLTDAKDALALATSPEERAAALQKLEQAVVRASELYSEFNAANDAGGKNAIGAALLGASLELQKNGGTLTAEQRQALAQTFSQIGTALGAYEGSLFSGNTNLARAVQALVDGITGTGAVGSAISGSVANANFAQSSINSTGTFSPEGVIKYSQLAGVKISTVDDLAEAITKGLVRPSQLPVDYVVSQDGTKLILNTRTSVALFRAGIPQSQWYGANKTGMQVPDMPAGTTFDDLAAAQLTRNNLPPTGTSNPPGGVR